MEPIDIVLDTNVFISALRSKRGASFKLLSLLGSEHFRLNISVPLFLEYEAVAKRKCHNLPLEHSDVDDILDYIASVSIKREIFFLWRPYLKDAKDDLVLEIAVESGSQYIVTYNQNDFKGTEKFGIKTVTPKSFLKKLGVIK